MCIFDMSVTCNMRYALILYKGQHITVHGIIVGLFDSVLRNTCCTCGYRNYPCVGLLFFFFFCVCFSVFVCMCTFCRCPPV